MPFTTDGVAQNKFQFRAVKSTFSGVDFIFIAVFIQRVSQRIFAQIPNFIRTDTINAVRTSRQINFDVIKTKVFINIKNQFHRTNALIFHLFRSAENVRIILRKFTHTHQAHQRTRSLITVYLTKFSHTQRQITIRLNALFINQQSARAIHWFNAKFFTVFGFTGIVMRTILIPVTGGHPQAFIHNTRCRNFFITVMFLAIAHIFNQLAIYFISFVMPKNSTRSIFRLKMEQIHFLTDFTMVALSGFFKHCQICVQFLFSRPSGCIQTLQHFIFSITAPISAGNFSNFECIADFTG